MSPVHVQPGVFENIYDSYAAVMYGCVIRIVKDKEDAENVLRTIFLRLPKILPREMPGKIWFIKYAMQQSFLFLKENNRTALLRQSIKESVSNAGISPKPAF